MCIRDSSLVSWPSRASLPVSERDAPIANVPDPAELVLVASPLEPHPATTRLLAVMTTATANVLDLTTFASFVALFACRLSTVRVVTNQALWILDPRSG